MQGEFSRKHKEELLLNYITVIPKSTTVELIVSQRSTAIQKSHAVDKTVFSLELTVTTNQYQNC
jgi:hypothetical protein